MIWSHGDFVRELRRHLVELESLRKKLSGRPDTEEILERLKTSVYHLLRKVDEAFRAAFEIKVSAVIQAVSPAHNDEDTLDGPSPELAATIESALAHSDAIEKLAGALSKLCGAPPGGTGSSDVQALDNPSSSGAPMGTKCRACGKPLVSSVLAGEQVLEADGGWYHAACRHSAKHAGRIVWQPNVRN